MSGGTSDGRPRPAPLLADAHHEHAQRGQRQPSPSPVTGRIPALMYMTAFFIARPLAGTEGETNRVLGAAVHAVAAQDALTVLHLRSMHHPVHVQAHGAVAAAG